VSNTGRLALSFDPEPGANVDAITERLRRVASDLPIDRVELGPAATPPKPPAQERASLPLVVVERPRCPQCRSPEYKVRKRRDVSGSIEARYVSCIQCGKHFLIYAT
jgi:hypothetical protein